MRKPAMPAVLIFLAMVAFTLWAYPQLPPRIATHFDLAGRPGGWSPRLFGALIFPALGLLLLLAFAVLPRMDPLRRNFPANAPVWWLIATGILAVLAAIQVLILGSALGWGLDASAVVGVSVGGLFILLGTQLGRIRPSWFLGIRTPWTLSSEDVWRRTHRLGGTLFILAGIGILAAGLVRTRAVLFVAIALGLVAALVPVAYSWVLWRREELARGSAPMEGRAQAGRPESGAESGRPRA